MAFEIKFLNFVSLTLDEHLYAQLSNVSFVALLCDVYDLVDLSSFIS